MSFPEPDTQTRAPEQFGHPTTWTAIAAVGNPPRKSSRFGKVVLAVAGALILMAAAAFGTWFLTRPTPTTPGTSPAAADTFVASGLVVLQRGQFVWQSEADPTCAGLGGFADIRAGTEVTVTDASGKVLTVGAIEAGTAGGITTEADGMHRATTCTLPFRALIVPRGVGPYGVSVGHRGTVHYSEAELDTTVVTLGF